MEDHQDLQEIILDNVSHHLPYAMVFVSILKLILAIVVPVAMLVHQANLVLVVYVNRLVHVILTLNVSKEAFASQVMVFVHVKGVRLLLANLLLGVHVVLTPNVVVFCNSGTCALCTDSSQCTPGNPGSQCVPNAGNPGNAGICVPLPCDDFPNNICPTGSICTNGLCVVG